MPPKSVQEWCCKKQPNCKALELFFAWVFSLCGGNFQTSVAGKNIASSNGSRLCINSELFTYFRYAVAKSFASKRLIEEVHPGQCLCATMEGTVEFMQCGVYSEVQPILYYIRDGMLYSGGYLVQWRDIISTVKDIQYSGGISSVQWRDIITKVEDILYCGGISLVQNSMY